MIISKSIAYRTSPSIKSGVETLVEATHTLDLRLPSRNANVSQIKWGIYGSGTYTIVFVLILIICEQRHRPWEGRGILLLQPQVSQPRGRSRHGCPTWALPRVVNGGWFLGQYVFLSLPASSHCFLIRLPQHDYYTDVCYYLVGVLEAQCTPLAAA